MLTLHARQPQNSVSMAHVHLPYGRVPVTKPRLPHKTGTDDAGKDARGQAHLHRQSTLEHVLGLADAALTEVPRLHAAVKNKSKNQFK